MAVIADNLARIRERIERACAQAGRSSDALRLIAVTKNQTPAAITALIAAEQWDFGENRIEHLSDMHAAAPAGGRFHYIGRVQGRQLAKIVPLCESLHSLCEDGHIDRLGRLCADRSDPFPVFLQVNTADEAQKAGLHPDQLTAALDRTAQWPGIQVVGLMCMAPDRSIPGVDAAQIRRCFAALRELAQRHDLHRLSMGMSGDLEEAIAEGATDLRIGSVLFA